MAWHPRCKSEGGGGGVVLFIQEKTPNMSDTDTDGSDGTTSLVESKVALSDFHLR